MWCAHGAKVDRFWDWFRRFPTWADVPVLQHCFSLYPGYPGSQKICQHKFASSSIMYLIFRSPMSTSNEAFFSNEQLGWDNNREGVHWLFAQQNQPSPDDFIPNWDYKSQKQIPLRLTTRSPWPMEFFFVNLAKPNRKMGQGGLLRGRWFWPRGLEETREMRETVTEKHGKTNRFYFYLNQQSMG